jgi:hypothetical protein
LEVPKWSAPEQALLVQIQKLEIIAGLIQDRNAEWPVAWPD